MTIKTSHNFVKKANTDDNSKLAYGIDLGTTNSAIAFLGGSGIPEMIELSNGKNTMPSCVLWNSNKQGTPDEWVVGDEAYKHRDESNVCYSVKRLMGSDQKVIFRHANRTKELTPVEVSSLILKELVQKASKLHPNIKDVVITVPAKFSTKQVQDTRDAASLAGLNVLGISKEPTAAAEAYHLDCNNETAAVFDLGGGTFDVSIVDFSSSKTSGDSDFLNAIGLSDVSDNAEEILTVKATRGDTHLGGDDLDELMYKFVIDYLKTHNKIDPSKITLQSREALLLQLNQKKLIGDYLRLDLDVRLAFTDGTKGRYTVPFSSEDYENCTKIIFDKANSYVRDVLKDATLNIQDIVLVGGSTKNKVLQKLLKESYPNCTVYNHLNPDEAVALGAAIDAARIKFGKGSMTVFDVIGNTVGIVADNKVLPIIEQNTPIPCSSNRVLATVAENQEEILVEVREGTSHRVEECDYLGHFSIKRPKNRKKGRVSVIVTFSVNTNGLLSCCVKVDNQIFEKNLVNLLGRNPTNTFSSLDTSVSLKDKVKFSHWEKIIKSFDDLSVVKEGLALLKAAQSDSSKSMEVAAFIRRHRC